jgi:hypothetical protein
MQPGARCPARVSNGANFPAMRGNSRRKSPPHTKIFHYTKSLRAISDVVLTRWQGKLTVRGAPGQERGNGLCYIHIGNSLINIYALSCDMGWTFASGKTGGRGAATDGIA